MEVVKAPDPRLKIQTKPVKKINPALLQILKEMIKLTKTFKEPEGVGLASTQIGLDEAFFVARLDESAKPRQRRAKRAKNGNPPAGGFISVINPKVLSYGKRTKKYFEGCLSSPNIWGEVKRYTLMKVSYQDSHGKSITQTFKGITAWIFQHEMDHLNGILFQDRVLQQKGKFFKFTGRDKTGQDIFEEVTI